MRRLTSSGTLSSKQRLPASMWKTGIPIRLAMITDRALFVSPSTSTLSGFFSLKTRSQPSSTPPICLPGLEMSTPRKTSGRLTPSSAKNTSLRAGSLFWPVWTIVWLQRPSSFPIRMESRIISGRVPRTVTSFI